MVRKRTAGSRYIEKKSGYIQFRVSETEREILQASKEIKGYNSMTRYILDTLMGERNRSIAGTLPKENDKQAKQREKEARAVLAKIDSLVRQVKGVAGNYNQVTAMLNKIFKEQKGESARLVIVRRSVRLESMTRKLVELTRDIEREVKKRFADEEGNSKTLVESESPFKASDLAETN